MPQSPNSSGWLARWWRAATEPFFIDEERTIAQQRLRRILLWLPVVVPVVLAVAGLGIYFALGIRARQLAEDGMESLRVKSYAKAQRQIMSAHGLRPGEPAVRRAETYLRSRMNNTNALAGWRGLAAEFDLSAEESEERARLTMLYGDKEEFLAAANALEKKGGGEQAASFRSMRALQARDLARAVEEARAAGGNDESKLDLLRLLILRHGPTLARSPSPSTDDQRALDEIVSIVDSLEGRPAYHEAVAAALLGAPIPPGRAAVWAGSAVQDLSPDNEALLPATDILIGVRGEDPVEWTKRLRPIFEKAALARRARFAQWLNLHGQSEAALDMLSTEEAAGETAAYAARADALAKLGQWQALYQLSEVPGGAPESLRLGSRTLAARRSERDDEVPGLLGSALRAAQAEGRLPETLATLDRAGETALLDDILPGLCADGKTASCFALVRHRLAQNGDHALLLQTFEAARAVAPDLPAVQDFARRQDVLAGRPVDAAETAAAVQAEPSDLPARLTHGLLLLREGRAAEALATFDDIDVYVGRLPAGDQAIVYAIQAANGQDFEANALLAAIDRTRLTEAEAALLNP